MFQNNTTDIEMRSLFGGGRLLIIAGILPYLIAGAAGLHGTHMFVAATRRKQVKTGESA